MRCLLQLNRFAVVVLLIFGGQIVRAHDHLAAGATSNTNGATLIFQNDGDFGGDTGFVFNLAQGTTNDAYLGYYYTDDLVFIALAATPDDGGPEPGAAALGTYVQVKLRSIEGPAGASFGFWETAQDGVDSTNLTWSLPVPFHNGTNLIHVSESDGSLTSDPYGHLHGRIYSFDKPGLYKVTWQFVDTSTNGPNGGPVDLPSAPFYLYYQADLTTGEINVSTNGVNVTFACPSDIPDSGIGPATNYQLLSSPVLGPNAVWQPTGDVVVGDDHLHTVTVPITGNTSFFRLKTQ
ncbi:MAG TPA: hypothetical protein VFE51_13405 [Verrucomicrobiae bacterium]|nr:hypothetical protein [Verrucomicrobiae bacterium]